jgi:hypothetical protein
MTTVLAVLAVLLLVMGADGRDCSDVANELKKEPQEKAAGEQL